jgi:plasmid stabilization system protein ParE
VLNVKINLSKETVDLVHESHIIIYKINQKENEILIVRIFHGSQDYKDKV